MEKLVAEETAAGETVAGEDGLGEKTPLSNFTIKDFFFAFHRFFGVNE